MGLLFPPHINTVKNLEKNTKLPEILWVSPTLPPFCGLFITPNFQISGEIASQDFSSTLGIPGWCSRFPLLLLPPGVPGQPCRGFAAGSHPFSPVPPVPWRTWPRLLRNPAACSERCRPAGRPGALRQRGATGCPLRLGQEAEPLLRALQAPPARQARTRCPPHQRRSTPLLFPRVWREECEAERSAMSLCHSLLVFLLLSRTDFHGFLLSVYGSLCLRQSGVVLCVLLPPATPAREGAGGEGRIVGFKVML